MPSSDDQANDDRAAENRTAEERAAEEQAAEDLTAEEQLAFELLRRSAYGRVATSMRALPFLAAARHIVVGGRLLLRMHKGDGYHQACVGSVVAYGSDNLGAGPGDQWSVQLVGYCTAVEPTTAELELLGPGPHFVDGEPFDPVHLAIEPQLIKVHTLRGARESEHRRQHTCCA